MRDRSLVTIDQNALFEKLDAMTDDELLALDPICLALREYRQSVDLPVQHWITLPNRIAALGALEFCRLSERLDYLEEDTPSPIPAVDGE